jgi:neurotransmitter:Na+ symporter, NSS family
VEKARAEINETSDVNVGRWWSVCIRLVPVLFVIIFGWWVYQSVVDHPETWWNPFETFSTGTMVVQWLVLFAIVFLLNDFMARRVARGPMTAADPTATPGPRSGAPSGPPPQRP